MPMKPEYSIWLLPEAAQERMLAGTISRLAEVQRESAFFPHVTLQGDLCQSPDELVEPLAELAKDVPVQRWPIAAVECGDHFFRCLYLRFDAGPMLAALQERVRAFTKTADGLAPFPHLSLAYGKVMSNTRRERDELAASLGLQEIVFDRVALIRSSKEVPIAEWRLLCSFPLAGCQRPELLIRC